MAEGLARGMDGFDAVASAGSDPSGRVNPLAVKAMAEIGIDIKAHTSKALADQKLGSFDLIVTLCAGEVCPYVPGKTKLAWPVEDPAGHDDESAEAQLARFRTARDEIKSKLEAFVSAKKAS